MALLNSLRIYYTQNTDNDVVKLRQSEACATKMFLLSANGDCLALQIMNQIS